MHFIFIKDERSRKDKGELLAGEEGTSRSLLQDALYFSSMVGFLVIVNWARPQPGDQGIWVLIYNAKWYLSAVFLLLTAAMLVLWFKKDERIEWVSSSWDFTKQIMPYLLIGVLLAGLLLGRPGGEGLIPSWVIEDAVGGNSFASNFFASIAGAFMYFATLTEVPILQGLIGAGMGKGPALALLLAGPALSLPSMLVIRSVIGTKKTAVYVGLVVVMATVSGIIFGNIVT